MELSNKLTNQTPSSKNNYPHTIPTKNKLPLTPSATTQQYRLLSYEYNHNQLEFKLELEDTNGYSIYTTANDALHNKIILAGLSKADIMTICYIAEYESSTNHKPT